MYTNVLLSLKQFHCNIVRSVPLKLMKIGKEKGRYGRGLLTIISLPLRHPKVAAETQDTYYSYMYDSPAYIILLYCYESISLFININIAFLFWIIKELHKEFPTHFFRTVVISYMDNQYLSSGTYSVDKFN